MLKFIQNNREITALLAVVLLFVLPGFLDRQYLSMQTLTMVYSSAQILILLAMGATLVMLTRNIDVSVGSITGMCAVLLGMLLNAGYSLPVACVATLLLGLLAGFFNGVLVAWLKIPAIVATLGTLGLYRGIMLLWTGGKWIEGLPAELKQLSAPLLLGVEGAFDLLGDVACILGVKQILQRHHHVVGAAVAVDIVCNGNKSHAVLRQPALQIATCFDVINTGEVAKRVEDDRDVPVVRFCFDLFADEV